MVDEDLTGDDVISDMVGANAAGRRPAAGSMRGWGS
jgi:hypothetical protein